MNRRDFLQLSAGGVLGSFAQSVFPPVVPRVNGGINVPPLRRFETNAGFTSPIIVPRLVDIQMKLVYELGFEQMRMMISFERFGPNFFAAIPYVRAARALGIDVVGIVDQFSGVDLVRAIRDPVTRCEVLETYARIFGGFVPAASDAVARPGRFAAQILNEPTHFYGISPDVYVREFLRPAYLHLKEDDPSIRIVSTAPVSSADGFLRLQRMIEAGAENVCDFLAFHIYSARFVERLGELTEKPVWVTESGAEGTERHLPWFTSVFDAIRNAIPMAERIYWFDLFDRQANGFRLFDIVADPVEEFRAVAESIDLIGYLETRVKDASGNVALERYEELVPDIMLYFPTDEDIRIIESTSFGLPDELSG
jgi:hypothetical protein